MEKNKTLFGVNIFVASRRMGVIVILPMLSLGWRIEVESSIEEFTVLTLLPIGRD